MNRDITLSEDQARVVASRSTALVVVAPAGSGKTEVLARRIERVLTESAEDNYRVLALSYTVKAADELKARLRDRLGDLHRRVDADTTHGFALNLLRSYGTRIDLPREPEVLTRDEDRVEALSNYLAELGEEAPRDPVELFRVMDVERAQLKEGRMTRLWQAALAGRGAVDYAAMLERAIELTDNGWVSRHLHRLYGHVALDEAQNLSPLQFRLLCNIVGAGADAIGCTLVGDERQSIVGFAGADGRLIDSFEQQYGAERIELATNYRSAEAIVQAGRRVEKALGRIGEPSDLTYPARGRVEVVDCTDEAAEADFVSLWVVGLLERGLPREALAPGEAQTVSPDEVAVLARSGAALRLVREALDSRGVAWAQSSAEEEWVASRAAQIVVAVVAYLSAPQHASTLRTLSRLSELDLGSAADIQAVIAASPDSDVAPLAPLLSTSGPSSFVDALANLEMSDPDWPNDYALLSETFDLFRERYQVTDQTFGNFNQSIARARRGDALGGGVRLLSVHKSQGREFKAVALVGCNDGQLPDFRAESREEKMAELRVFYVAVTRASRLLVLSRALSRRTRFGSRRTDPSPYLNLIK